MELTVSQLIKIIIGILVVVAVVIGLYYGYKSIMDYYKNLMNEPAKIFFSLLK
jgi:uncharacterized protein YpmB